MGALVELVVSLVPQAVEELCTLKRSEAAADRAAAEPLQALVVAAVEAELLQLAPQQQPLQVLTEDYQEQPVLIPMPLVAMAAAAGHQVRRARLLAVMPAALLNMVAVEAAAWLVALVPLALVAARYTAEAAEAAALALTRATTAAQPVPVEQVNPIVAAAAARLALHVQVLKLVVLAATVVQ
jgi:hypothetical protein